MSLAFVENRNAAYGTVVIVSAVIHVAMVPVLPTPQRIRILVMADVIHTRDAYSMFLPAVVQPDAVPAEPDIKYAVFVLADPVVRLVSGHG